jgi:methylated-DNA-[protein]-cysteine S-methyltransferase
MRDDDAARGHVLFDTAFGACGIAWGPAGITSVQLPEASRAATERRLAASGGAPREAPPPPDVARAIERIARHLATGREDLTGLALDWSGVTPFRRRVYEASLAIAPGEIVSYGELATRVGSPGAFRAVGQAMAKNPFPVVVPCHRVVASGGRDWSRATPAARRAKLRGFSAHGGVDTKARLLALEADAAPRAPASGPAGGAAPELAAPGLDAARAR